VAHLLGLHGLQVIPVVGWLLSRWRAIESPRAATAVTVLFALAYAALTALAFEQARSAQPLIAL
jgi:hypothetical protein